MERDTESPIDVVGINEATTLPFNLVSLHFSFPQDHPFRRKSTSN